MGRYLNADIVFDYDVGIIGYALFTYCGNNPIRRIDISGMDCTDMLDGNKEEDEPYHNHGGGHNYNNLPSDNPGGGSFDPYQAIIDGTYTPQQASTGSFIIPNEAWYVLDYVNSHNGSPPQGYKGGRQFLNDGRGGGQQLPESNAPYYEYDIYPYTKGMSRGAERLVIGQTGNAWYTPDHYITFIAME